MKQSFFNILSLAATLSFFAPMLLAIARKLTRDPFFMSFASFWAFSGLIGLTDFIPGIDKETSEKIGIAANMIDIPIVLTLLYYTTTSLMIRRFTAFAFVCYLLADLAGIVIKGFSYAALKYTLGIGICLALIAIGWEISRYVKKVETSNRQTSKVLVYAAMFFEYTCFIVVYVVDYFAPEDFYRARRDDMYFIYYISTIIGIIIACSGYLFYKKHSEKKVLVNEVKIDII